MSTASSTPAATVTVTLPATAPSNDPPTQPTTGGVNSATGTTATSTTSSPATTVSGSAPPAKTQRAGLNMADFLAKNPLPKPQALTANVKASQTTPAVTPATVQSPTCVIMPCEEELRHDFCAERLINAVAASAGIAARTLGRKIHQFWDIGQTVTFSFISGHPNQQTKAAYLLTAPYAFYWINLSFSQVAQDGDIRISFDSTMGNWVYVGRTAAEVPKPRPTLNFASLTEDSNTTAEEWNVMNHMVGHIYGLLHEYPGESNATVGQIPTLDAKLVHEYYAYTLGWDVKKIDRHILDVYASAPLSNFPAYNPDSLMRYFMPAALNTNSTPTWPDAATYPAAPTNMANQDISYLGCVYPITLPGIDTSLSGLGIDPDAKAAFKAALNAGNLNQARAIACAWCIVGRSATVKA
ncbi:ZnMc domain-containing protein [Mycena indigotica]|uniref:ZnMc domain-containing protein n=1 Tax=Mycena indigotica TaxID=2126181 RepID=A0A8H6VQQ9_9AGAR|nr:ZnMc domain-containing protein [Mycena indigotica]KAF7290219.1 ZnMc domain-containing protein [Mycena indigotica]